MCLNRRCCVEGFFCTETSAVYSLFPQVCLSCSHGQICMSTTWNCWNVAEEEGKGGTTPLPLINSTHFHDQQDSKSINSWSQIHMTVGKPNDHHAGACLLPRKQAHPCRKSSPRVLISSELPGCEHIRKYWLAGFRGSLSISLTDKVLSSFKGASP